MSLIPPPPPPPPFFFFPLISLFANWLPLNLGLIGHASNLCCPLCKFASNPKNTDVDNNEPVDNEDQQHLRPRVGQNFFWQGVNSSEILGLESMRDDKEYRSNHVAFRNKVRQSGVSTTSLSVLAADLGMRDTCLSFLQGFDFGRFTKKD